MQLQMVDNSIRQVKQNLISTLKLPDVPLVPRVILSPTQSPKSEFWDSWPLRPPPILVQMTVFMSPLLQIQITKHLYYM